MSEEALPLRRRAPTRLVLIPRRWLSVALAGLLPLLLFTFLAGRWTAPGAASVVVFENEHQERPKPEGFGFAKANDDPEPAPTPSSKTGIEASSAELKPAIVAAPSQAEGALSRPRSAEPPTVQKDRSSVDPSSPVTYATSTPRGAFGVQVAAHETLAEAEAFVRAHRSLFEALGPIHVVERRIEGKAWFRIRVGVFTGRAAARAARQNLPEALGRGAMVVRYQ